MNQGLSEAIIALKSGRFPEAEYICRQLLAIEPNNPDVLNLMGIVAGVAEQHADAAKYMRRSVELAPHVAEYRKNLARALIHLEQLDEASQVLEPLISVPSPSADALAMAGMILGQKGDLAAGIESLKKALAIAPNSPALYFNIAEMYRQSADFEAARNSLKQCLQFAPDHADALNNLAGLQLANGQFLEALASIQQMLKINPRSAQAYCNLGSLLGAAGDATAASLAFRNALVIEPGSSRARFQLASMLIRDGDLNESESLVHELSQAPDIDPTILKTMHARILERKGKVEEAWEIMETIPPDARQQPDVATMYALLQEQRGDKAAAVETLENVIRSNEVAAIEGVGINFTLGQLYDALGQFEKAFEAYRLGNENRKRTFVIFGNKEKDEPKGIDLIRELYAPSRYAAVPDSKLDTDVPIFVLGMPRSGTTLTEQILASHPNVCGAGELSKFQELIRDSFGKSEKQSKQFEINVDDPSQGRNCLVPQGWETITSEQLTQLGSKYLEFIQKIGGTAPRITDKMPYNYYVAGLIAKVFPNARIVHCHRSPLDTCLSCYFQNFTAGSQYSFDLKELGEFYREYEEIMDHWKNVVRVPMFEVQYEELVHDPERVVRGLLDYCGLEWDPNCLKFNRSSRVVATASYQQVRQPLYTRSAGRWRHFIQHLRPLVDALGLDYEECCRKAAESEPEK